MQKKSLLRYSSINILYTNWFQKYIKQENEIQGNDVGGYVCTNLSHSCALSALIWDGYLD